MTVEEFYDENYDTHHFYVKTRLMPLVSPKKVQQAMEDYYLHKIKGKKVICQSGCATGKNHGDASEKDDLKAMTGYILQGLLAGGHTNGIKREIVTERAIGLAKDALNEIEEK